MGFFTSLLLQYIIMHCYIIPECVHKSNLCCCIAASAVYTPENYTTDVDPFMYVCAYLLFCKILKQL